MGCLQRRSVSCGRVLKHVQPARGHGVTSVRASRRKLLLMSLRALCCEIGALCIITSRRDRQSDEDGHAPGASLQRSGADWPSSFVLADPKLVILGIIFEAQYRAATGMAFPSPDQRCAGSNQAQLTMMLMLFLCLCNK